MGVSGIGLWVSRISVSGEAEGKKSLGIKTSVSLVVRVLEMNVGCSSH